MRPKAYSANVSTRLHARINDEARKSEQAAPCKKFEALGSGGESAAR